MPTVRPGAPSASRLHTRHAGLTAPRWVDIPWATMSSTHPVRRTLATLGAAALVATLGAGLGAGSADAHHAKPPGPIHAGSEFGWGKAPVDYRFVGPLKHSQWRVKGPGAVRNQHGMLTLNTGKRGTVSATQITKGHEVGRWEIRLRSRQYGHGHQNYRVLTELVPAGKRPEYCGANNIALEAYTPNKTMVSHYIRSRPDNRYIMRKGMGLKNDQWHTFAVEVTRKRSRANLERLLTQPCPYCGGRGRIRSIATICLNLRKELLRLRGKRTLQSELLLRVHPEVARALQQEERAILEELERLLGVGVMLQGDPELHHERFDVVEV